MKIKLKITDDFFALLGIVSLLGVCLCGTYFYLSWSQSVYEYWLAMYAKHPVHLNFFLSAIISMLLNGVGLLLNIITEVLRHL